jgi:lysophospholipase L1-like esterase
VQFYSIFIIQIMHLEDIEVKGTLGILVNIFILVVISFLFLVFVSMVVTNAPQPTKIGNISSAAVVVAPKVDFMTVFVGDSLTYGTGASKNLVTRLADEFPEGKFINLGIPGDNTAGMLMRMKDVDRHDPKRVVIWGGVNDIPMGASAKVIESNLQTMYDYYQSQGYQVWAFTITPRGGNTEAMIATRDEVNKWMINEAKNVDRVVDTFSMVVDQYDTRYISRKYDSDSVHFNDLFYKDLAELLIPDYGK